MSAGYSATPLGRKLSLKDGIRVWFDNMPQSVRNEIDNYGLNLIEEEQPTKGLNAAHIFVKKRVTLEKHLSELRHLIDPSGQVWVSWPKKASQVPTDISEHDVREMALSMGYVDIKKCAVDSVWAGLKLVIRKELRQKA